MNSVSYNKFILNTFKNYSLVFIVLPLIQLMMYSWFMVTEHWEGYSFITNISNLYSMSLLIINLIIWILIKFNMHKQTDRSSRFLHILFKLLMCILIYKNIESVFYYIGTSHFLLKLETAEILKFQLANGLRTAFNLFVLVFIIVVVRSYKRKINYNGRQILNVMAHITLISANIVLIYAIYSLVSSGGFGYDSSSRIWFRVLSNLIVSIAWIIELMVWSLIVIRFTRRYMPVSQEREDTHTDTLTILDSNDRILERTLKRYFLLVIGTSAVLMKLILYVYSLFKLLKNFQESARYNFYELITRLSVFTNMQMLLLLAELLVYVWLLKVVYVKAKEQIMFQVLILLMMALITIIQQAYLFYYLFIHATDFNNSDSLIMFVVLVSQSIMPLAVLTLFSVNYHKRMKPIIVSALSISYVSIIVISAILSTVKDFFSNELFLAGFRMDAFFLIQLNDVSFKGYNYIQALIMFATVIFWCGIALVYQSQYKKMYSNYNDTELLD